MTGTVTIWKNGEELARARYHSIKERNSIVSFFNLLYDALYHSKSFTVVVSPDDCTEAETVTQLSAGGCAYAYMRADRLHSDNDRPYNIVAS